MPEGNEVGAEPQQEIKGKYKPNAWERFLTGQILCPCCSCWTFFIAGIVFTMAFVMKARSAGDDLFSFDAEPVKSDRIVQAKYAFDEARGEAVGCDDEAHEVEATCRADQACSWDNITSVCEDVSPCPAPAPRPRENGIPAKGRSAGRPTWMSVLYEAQNDGNLLDDDIMGHIMNFEEKLLTTANGAKSNGMASSWERDWCMKSYPPGNASSLGRCSPVTNLVGLFTMTPAARAIVRDQVVSEGYSNVKSLAQCLCSDQDALCSICDADGSLKPSTSWPAGMYSCLMSGLSTGGPAQSSNAGCGQSGLTGNAAQLQAYLRGLCQSRPNCQWSPFGANWLCSSTGFYASDWQGLISGSDKVAALDKMCNENHTGWWNMRKTVMPQSFECSVRKARFSRTLFYPGIEDPTDAEAYDKFESGYVKGRTGWYAKARALEAEVEKASGGKLRIILYSEATLMSQFMEILIFDSVLSITSMLFVYFYMWWTLESFFLASCAMFEIVFSLPVALCLWTLVLQQKVLFTQMLVIYMILGIGADDAFILYDAWLQARFAGEEVMQHWTTRFAYAYRKSFHAMAITTATTCGSFVIGAFSPLPGVRDFCIFAAVVVLVDWLFCISFFASAVVVYERFFKSNSRQPGDCLGPGCCWGCCRAVAKAGCGDRCVDSEVSETPKKRGMELFCEGPLFDFLRKTRFVWVVVWSVLIIVGACVAGATLRTAKKRAPVGREDIDAIRGLEILLDEFSFRGSPKVHFVWGLDSQEPATEWDGMTAKPRYSSIGPLKTPAGQAELLRLCRAADLGDDAARTRCDDGRHCLVLGKGAGGRCPKNERMWREQGIYVPDDVLCATGRHCFMEDFAEWWAATKDDCQSKTQYDCNAHTGCTWYAGGAGSTSAYCHSATSPDSYSGLPEAEFVQKLLSTNFSDYWSSKNDLLRAMGRGFEVSDRRDMTGWKQDGAGGVKLAWVSFNATIPNENTVDEANTWYDRWEAFRTTHGSNLGGFQSTEVYEFMVTQNAMVRAAIQGILLSLFVAFVVLVMTTQNWWVSLLGLVNIGGISSVFLGVMPILGWSLGENECIFLIAVVGLSVDYTVHLLHSYNHGEGEREDRAKHALAEMGISVTNSAITTLLASIILFGCGFYFFFQFGAFIFFVIGFSIVMSITFLIPLLLVVGPRSGRGSIFCWRTKVSPGDIEPQEIITGSKKA